MAFLDLPEIYEEVIELTGGEEGTSYDIISMRRSLNLLMADWENRGLHLWKVTSGSVPTVDGTTAYTLPSGLVDILDVTIPGSNGLVLTRISRQEYEERDWIGTEGRPTQFYLDRQVTPSLHLYPKPDDAYTIEYHYMAEFDRLARGDTSIDIPGRALPSLIYGLAYLYAQKRRTINPAVVASLKAEYMERIIAMLEEDRERVGVKFGIRGYG